MKLDIYGKKLLVTLGTTAILGTTIIGGTTFAAANSNSKNINVENLVKNRENLKNKSESIKLSDEQKTEIEEMKERRKKMGEKWNNLDESAKKEVYLLNDKKIELQKEMVRKNLELGLIEEKEANEIINIIDEINSNSKKFGEMPSMIEGHTK